MNKKGQTLVNLGNLENEIPINSKELLKFLQWENVQNVDLFFRLSSVKICK